MRAGVGRTSAFSGADRSDAAFLRAAGDGWCLIYLFCASPRVDSPIAFDGRCAY